MNKYTSDTFNFRTTFFALIAFCFAFLLACETPEKVLKSNDLEYKKAKAIFWYNKKEYVKCIPVMEELIGLLKGRQSTEDLYYMYANANFKQGDYMISAYHFKNYYDLYSSSDKAEEALFMQAKSLQNLTSKPDLDQTYTFKAIEAYQLFLNSYPGSHFIEESNTAMAELRRKLEKKALQGAELYFKTSNYKAAATCYTNILKDFPDIQESEKVSFMIVKSGFRYAQNSTPEKKAERFNILIKNYYDFQYKFGSSKFLQEAKKYEEQAHYLAVQSAFQWAEISPLADREKHFASFFREAERHKSYIAADSKTAEKIAEWVEKGYFLVLKSNFELSEARKSTLKVPALEQTLKTYYTFVDQFPKSRFIKEAERIYNESSEQLKKLKNNG
ncbi:MAG: outer membrane protein assembly factor BamD [Bacteroidetes bacterium]|nr:outer membrane protein assembly factor BamD [Bacteroidota bacterium]